MVDVLAGLNHWDWLALGGLLLICEVFGAGGYLLWLGLAALATGALSLVFPAGSGLWQALLFAVLALVCVGLWWRYQPRHRRDPAAPELNQRGRELIGRTLSLHEPIVGGRGKVKVGDSLWLVSGPDLPQGTSVRVVDQDGVLLKVEPAL